MFRGEESSIIVHSVCGYPSWDAQQARFEGKDFSARYVIKAVKRDLQALQRSYVNFGNPARKYNHENYEALVDRAIDQIVLHIRKLQMQDIALVAVPNSSATPEVAIFRNAELAERIAAAVGNGCRAYTGLRFAQAVVPAHAGGARDPAQLLAAMVLTQEIPPGNILLFDDVCSSGAHLLAAQRLIPAARRPEHAVVFGRTINDPTHRMMGVDDEILRMRF